MKVPVSVVIVEQQRVSTVEPEIAASSGITAPLSGF